MTQAAAPWDHATSRPPSVSFSTACMTVRRSVFSRGSTTWVSGSPKRQLYSMTLGPWGVSISPK